MQVVINACYGGFGLSDAAYERLIALGVPVRAYVEQQQDPVTKLYLPEPRNGEVIFDRELTHDVFTEIYHKYKGTSALLARYWETWLDGQRSHPLLLQVVRELGDAANGTCAKLRIVDVPDGVEYEIKEYDGNEHVAETHRTWS